MVLLHSTVPYLGIKLSYKTLQSTSLQHRLLSGLRAFQRLRPWLCSKKGLSSRQRDSLWCSVVRTTTLYGLHVIGCRPAGLRKLLSQLTLQRRMLMHDHSRDTHRTHEEFHAVFELEPPAIFLRRACLRTLQGRYDTLNKLDHTDILHQIPLTETRKLVSLLDQWIASQAIPVDYTVPAFQRRTCLARFATAALLIRHEHQTHARGHGRLFQFRLDRDALAGLPQCRHCDKTFQSWTNLRTHIEFGNCSQFDASQAASMELDQLRATAVPLIQSTSFQALGENKELVDYMLTHCCVCGKQQSRFSDMAHHLQLEHGNLALVSQRLYEEWAQKRSSPCELCQVQYRVSHQCKILLQAAVIQQWHRLSTEAPLPHAHPHPAEQDLTDHICIHCAELYPTRDALASHLQADHERFCCTRDTVLGTTVCRHCRSHFGELWELRRHIDRGSCDQLDPLGDQELGTVMRSDDYIMPLIQAGKWGEVTRDSAVRHKLTMLCSFCGQSYTRTADLVRHLQCHHGGFYRAADLTSNTIDEARLPCICNPCRVPQPRSHRCPAYRQLAMLQHLVDPRHRQLMLPWTPTMTSVHKLIHCHTALHAQVPELAPWLMTPDEKPWTFILRYSQELSHSCLLCARTAGSSNVLIDHLQQYHRRESGHNDFLLHLLHRFLSAQQPALRDPLPCPWCKQAHKDYAVLDDSVWSKIQHKCATLLNLGCALTWLRPEVPDGRADASHRRRSTEPGGPSILKYARVTGRDGPTSSREESSPGRCPKVDAEKKTDSPVLTSEIRDDSLDLLHQGRGTAAGDQAMPLDGTASGAPRGFFELGFYAGLVCDVLPTGQFRSRALATQSSKSMARPTTRPDSDAFALLPHPSHSDRTGHPVSEAEDPVGRSWHQGRSSQEPDHTGGLELSLPNAACSATAIGGESIIPHLMDHDGISPGPHAASLPGTLQLCPVLRDGLRPEPSRCDPVEAPDLLEERLLVQLDEATDGVIPLASDRCSDETTWPATEQARPGYSGYPPSSKGEEMKRQWIDKLLVMQCANTSNWCYANAGLVTMFWSLLHSSSFDEYTFRTAWEAVQGLLPSVTADETVDLASHSRLVELFQGKPHGEQRDIGEFISEALLWCKSSRLSQAWERRFEASGSCSCYESGSDFQPIALVHLFELDKKRVTLTELLTPWLHCHSMTTAFTNLHGPKVFFLDRLIDSTRLLGHFNFVEFLEPVLLPFFVREGLELRWVAHHVVACVAHLGDSLKGHFRALLKDPRSGKLWLCDDHQPPSPVSEAPEFMHTRGILFWMLPISMGDDSDEDAP